MIKSSYRDYIKARGMLDYRLNPSVLFCYGISFHFSRDELVSFTMPSELEILKADAIDCTSNYPLLWLPSKILDHFPTEILGTHSKNCKATAEGIHR